MIIEFRFDVYQPQRGVTDFEIMSSLRDLFWCLPFSIIMSSLRDLFIQTSLAVVTLRFTNYALRKNLFINNISANPAMFFD